MLSVESNEEYHADTTHVSHSALEVFRYSARLFHDRYVSGDEPRAEPTPQMKLGSALHAALLEEHAFDDMIAPAPICDRRTKEGKATWAAFCASHGHKIILPADDYDAVMRMAASITSHREAGRLLFHDDRIVETPLRWTDPATGIDCKAKPDCYIPRAAIVDVKTCTNPETGAFARAALDLGYHRQAAFYLDAVHAAGDTDCGRFFFIAVSNKPSYEASVLSLDQAEIDLGRRQNAELLCRLEECRRTGQWASPWATGVNLLTFPKWCFSQENQ